MNAYDAKRAELAAINCRADMVAATLRQTRDPAELERVYAERRAVHVDATAAGFVRLFDGRYKLGKAHVAELAHA